MTKPIDPDIKTLRACCKALEHSSSPRMLRANLVYLWDRFIEHPPADPNAKLKEPAP